MFEFLRRILSSGSAPAAASTASSSLDTRAVILPPLEGFLRDELVRCPYFKPEARERVLQSWLDGTSLSKTGNKLTTEQKRELGLNPRLVLTDAVIDVMSAEGLKLPDPKSALRDVYIRASHRRSRLETVVRAHRVGATRFKWQPVRDLDDCAWCTAHSGESFGKDILVQIEENCSCEPYSRGYIEPLFPDLER